MPTVPQRNIEIKVRVDNLEAVHRRALELSADQHGSFDDSDTYFRVRHGRLKLRTSEGKEAGALIYYERADERISRVSEYRLVPVPDGSTLRDTLSAALGVLVKVRKTRTLLIYGATRIHLDRVESLGDFVELETVVGNQPLDVARFEHQTIYEALKLGSYEVVPVSYSDLLLNGS